MTRFILILALGAATSGMAAEENAAPTPKTKEAPTASRTSGAQRRVKDNLDIVTKNIAETKKNIEVSKVNIKTIETEIVKLQDMEREHVALKAKFAGFIASSNKTISDNEKAMRDLQNFEKKRKLASKGKDEGGEGITTAKEQDERKRWEATAKEKLAQVRKMHDEILKNLSEISGRKVPLEQQLKEWNRRQKEFETQLTQFEKRKDTLEKLTAEQ